MTRLLTIRDLIVVGLFAAGAGACKQNEVSKESDRAAERVNEVREEVQEQAQALGERVSDKTGDLVERTREAGEEIDEKISDEVEKTAAKANDVAGDVVEKAKDLSRANAELTPALAEFEAKRAARVNTLRAVHSVEASQPLLISALTTTLAPVPSGTERARIAEKMSVLEIRIDETAKLIEVLGHTDARDWEPRNEAIGDAMSRLEDARGEAWDVLDDVAKASGRTSMR